MMQMQQLLDTVARLPELERLNVWTDTDTQVDPADFKLNPELRYVEVLQIGFKRHVLEKDGELPVRYRDTQYSPQT
jgi:hypothetical protein